eukprot:COSAG05_NODE_2604_length_2851_cov_4.404433_2_plen_252_part_00
MRSIATVATCVFTGVNGVLFLASPQTPLGDMFPDLKEGTHEYLVGRVWIEVIGLCAIMWFLRQCPGSMGYFMASCAHIAMMSKHFFVDGLTPPPPVVAMGALTFLLTTYSNFVDEASKAGMGMYMLMCAATCATFWLVPALPLADTFPDVKEGSRAFEVSMFYEKVVGTMMLCLFLGSCPGPMGNAMAATAMACQMAYDKEIVGVSPPLPAMVMCGAAFASNWLAVLMGGGNSDAGGAPARKSSKSKKRVD